MRIALITTLLSIYAASIALLASGSDLLLLEINRKLPLGTPVTWAAMISLPLALRIGFSDLLSSKQLHLRALRLATNGALLAGALWGLAAFALAGTWFFNFSAEASSFIGSPRAGEGFWDLPLTVATLPWALLVVLAGVSVANARMNTP